MEKINWSERIQIYTDKIKMATWKFLFYGPTKSGKSYLASTFPNPLFIDTDGSMGGIKSGTTPKYIRIQPGDKNIYQTIREVLLLVKDNKEPFKYVETIVFDGLTTLADLILFK